MKKLVSDTLLAGLFVRFFPDGTGEVVAVSYTLWDGKPHPAP